ncbi:MAG: aconitate hydratase [Chlamydiae bacterium]|nr:aconitate hydratase [Chlamydiota bacterium]
MKALSNTLNTLKSLNGCYYYSLKSLEDQGLVKVSHLPISLRIILESVLRNCDGKTIKESDVLQLARWEGKGSKGGEVPFKVSRVLLQDFTGVPLLVDLAAMRDAVQEQGYNPSIIEPQVPVNLVIDHSVQVDRSGTDDAYAFNLKLEFERNIERYQFLKWGQSAFETFKVVPPGIGIVHQVNLEYLAEVISTEQRGVDKILFPDTLVGTDSHTTMINGLGIVGWGVGGIEAEAAMLGQPIALQMPEVIGFHLTGTLPNGATATDLALYITEILRQENVVDKFVEFFGEGTKKLTVADRATVANMAPEYGATMGFFPVDDKTLEYLKMTGRPEKQILLIEEYLTAQDLFGVRSLGELEFSKTLELDLSSIKPSVSGPKRPQDRLSLNEVKSIFQSLLQADVAQGGYGKKDKHTYPTIRIKPEGSVKHLNHRDSGGLETSPPGAPTDMVEMVENRPFTSPAGNPGYSVNSPGESTLSHGSIVIAAITSCTNTSNPAVMLAAGLLAKKAVTLGLKVQNTVKTSLAPGSRVVTEYLQHSGLSKYLDQLGFHLVGYGCTTCIGNSGPLDEKIEAAIKDNDLIAVSVLSGNRNFEARIHSAVKANFLMSPPLVVAYALAGKIDIDFASEPIGYSSSHQKVFLKDIWPDDEEIEQILLKHIQPSMFNEKYAHILENNPLWKQVQTSEGRQYDWSEESTYIQKPPYFQKFSLQSPPRADFKGMRCLALLGDSVTTDHISPAGSFNPSSPAGKFLISLGVEEKDFNSYGSRRGNHHIMMRGTFANVRIKNKMADGKEGGFTKLIPDGPILSIFDACQEYHKRKVPLILFAGKDYGMGSSRDWAAKGTNLLGVKAVVAKSFERIHRSNLIGMGVLPLEFTNEDSHESLGLSGEEQFTFHGMEGKLHPNQSVMLEIKKNDLTTSIPLKLRLDTQVEIDYFEAGGILPYVLRGLLSRQSFE